MFRIRVVVQDPNLPVDASTRGTLLTFARIPREGDRLVLDQALPWMVERTFLLPQPQPDEAVEVIIVSKRQP